MDINIMAATEPIRDKRHIRELAGYYLKRGQLRNHVLIILGVHTALRVGDLLRLRWDDVYDFDNHRVRESIMLTEQKTGKAKLLALNGSVMRALKLYSEIAAKPGGFLIENRRTGNAISRIQAYRITRAASDALKLQSRVSCHSLRKTFGYHAWRGGVSPAIIMEIYNHNSLAVTRRYLGVTQDDKDRVYRKMALLM
jgi:integrase